MSAQSAEIEKYRSIAIKNVLDELYRKLNFCLKLKDRQSKALNTILDGNDVFLLYERVWQIQRQQQRAYINNSILAYLL
jgi:hypothetical protein